MSEPKKKRTRMSNPADARIREIERMAEEEREWAALASPVTVRYVEPKVKKE